MAFVWQRLLAGRADDHSIVTAPIPDLLPVLVLTEAVTFPGAVWPMQLVGDAARPDR